MHCSLIAAHYYAVICEREKMKIIDWYFDSRTLLLLNPAIPELFGDDGYKHWQVHRYRWCKLKCPASQEAKKKKSI